MKRVTTSILVQVDQTDGMRTSPSHFDLTLHGADTVATVENVDAIRELLYTPHIAYSVLDLGLLQYRCISCLCQRVF